MIKNFLLIYVIMLVMVFFTSGCKKNQDLHLKNGSLLHEGVLLSMQNGDRACYLTFQDSPNQGNEVTIMADFSFCEEPQKYLNRKVRIRYQKTRVMAESCEGDVDCKKYEEVDLISELLF